MDKSEDEDWGRFHHEFLERSGPLHKFMVGSSRCCCCCTCAATKKRWMLKTLLNRRRRSTVQYVNSFALWLQRPWTTGFEPGMNDWLWGRDGLWRAVRRSRAMKTLWIGEVLFLQFLSSFSYRTCDAPSYGLIHVPPMHKGWLSSSFVLLFLPFVAETKRKHRRSYTWKQALRFLCCNSSQVRTRNQFQQPGMKSFVNVLCIDCYKYSCIELWSSSLVKINERCADCRQEDNSPDLLHYRPWESLICRVLAETTRNRPAAVPGFGNWKMRMRQELLQLHDHFPCRTQDHLLDCMHALQGYYRRRSIGFFEARSIVARTCILARFRGVKLWRSRNNFSNQLHALKHEDRLRSEWISCYDSPVCCCCLRLCIRGGGCGQDEKRRIGVCSAAWEL